MEAFLESLTPNDIRSMRELVVAGYLVVFVTLAVLRFLTHVIFQPAAWKNFFTSKGFLVAAAGAVVAAIIYLNLPPPELAQATSSAPDAILFWGMTKAGLMKLYEIVVLCVVAFATVHFGCRPLLNLAFARLSTYLSNRFPSLAAPPVVHPGRFGPTRIAISVILLAGIVWFAIWFELRSEEIFDRVIAGQMGGKFLYGLTKLQVLGIAELSVLLIVVLLILILVIRPLFKQAVANVPGVSRMTRRNFAIVAWVLGSAFFLRCIWRIYEIISL